MKNKTLRGNVGAFSGPHYPQSYGYADLVELKLLLELSAGGLPAKDAPTLKLEPIRAARKEMTGIR